MDFKEKIISIMKADKDCDWDAIAEHRNVMQCYKFNSAVVRALKRKGVEALLVGTFYPKDTPNCTNYYALARDKDSGQVVLIDAWINSKYEGMKEPFIGNMEETKRFMADSSPRVRWDVSRWNLDHIVISSLNENIPSATKEREAFREKWGEFGKTLVFDQPQAKPGAISFAKDSEPLPSSGHRISLQEMNNYAMMRGLNTNHLAVFSSEAPAAKEPDIIPVKSEEALSHPEEIHAHKARVSSARNETARRSWKDFFRRSQDSAEQSSQKSLER